MIAAIITAEIAFWVLLLGGLSLRYLFKVGPLSSIILASVPLVDLALVIFVSIDITRGAPPTAAHALAALYLGFTVAFGHTVIKRADAWFRYRFAEGPKPGKPTKGSRAEVRAIWKEWTRVVVAAVITAVGLGVMILTEGQPLPTSLEAAAQHPYWSTLLLTAMITVIWFLAGPAFAGRGEVEQHRDNDEAITQEEHVR